MYLTFTVPHWQSRYQQTFGRADGGSPDRQFSFHCHNCETTTYGVDIFQGLCMGADGKQALASITDLQSLYEAMWEAQRWLNEQVEGKKLF